MTNQTETQKRPPGQAMGPVPEVRQTWRASYSRTVAGLAAVAALVVSTITTPGAAYADLNCSDFPSQAAAQAHLRANPSDPDRLDSDNDGIACESNRSPFDRVPVNRNAAPAAPVQQPPAPPAQPPAPVVSVAPEGWTRITRIVDGDTVEVEGGFRVRLFGIDAPEVGTACSPAAVATLTGLVTDNGRDYSVYLEYGPRRSDQFGRTLAYAWVADGESWYLVNEWMALLGAANAWTEDGQFRETVMNAEYDAWANGRGCVWGG